MAECSYARCLQQRRFIKRELLRWSKDMVPIVGLERVAEELMGRRKWKLYQESLTRTHLNANITNIEQNEISNQNKELDQKSEKENLIGSALEENHTQDIDETTTIIKRELTKIVDDEKPSVLDIKREDLEETSINENIKLNNCTSQINKGVDENANGNAIIETNSDYPIDWKPNDKCNFCVDGKLLTVNEKGDLVAESGPALSEAELANRPLDTDSDSSDSSPESRINVNKAITSRLGDSLQHNMTSFESVAAQLAAFQSMQGFQPGLGQLYPGFWYQHQLAQQINSATPTTSETSAPALSPSPKDSPSPSDATGEQPLDLSAKASPNSSAGGDHKSNLRQKPTVTNRRNYTEEELHSALQDIITGKLGTRRAAVIYGIPRSTLRNKVYKIGMEQKRATPSSLHQHSLENLVDGDDDDKELSGDDEINEMKSSSLVTQSDELAARFATSHSSASALQKITKLNDSHATEMKATTSLEGHGTQKQQNTNLHSHSQTPPVQPPSYIDPNVLLFLSSMGMNSNMEHDPQILRELITSIIMKSEEQKKASAEGRDRDRESSVNNGKANMIDPRMQQYQHQHQHQHQHKQQQQQHSSQHHSGHSFQNRLPKSETPETVSSVDLNDSSDDPSVILKIPSYKPVAGSSTSSNKNGDGLSSPSSKMTSSMLAAAVSNQKSNNNLISPPAIRHSNDSQSSPNLYLKDVIANSISRTFSQQASREANAHKHNASSPIEPNDQYKRPSISVLKNIGGTDISRFASAPNLLGSNNINHHNSQNLANNAAGGKGTRPKRGKYRNYDRDSLVEAVKAVQRGEMSVHRAGSYYGVPHSTLEYKVKERHLMRPRKREPKPQPLDDRTVGTSCVGGNNGTSSASSKNSNIPNLTAVNSLDKLKASSSSSQKQSALKNNPPFTNISANGMKRPIFDPAMAAQLQYANPLIFWQHSTSPAFAGLPIDFQRTQAAAAAAAVAAGNSTSFPENLFTSQIMQRFQDETNRLTGGCNPSATPATNNNKNNYNNNTQSSSHETSPSPSLALTTNSNKSNSGNSLPSKTPREIAETLYDSGGANGSSFLDGIIRKTLDRKSTERPHSHGALLDQLVKNSKPPALVNHSEHLLSNSVSGSKMKRHASPDNYFDIDIKRERSSPQSSDSSSSEESEKNHPMSLNDQQSDHENDSDSDSLDKSHHHHNQIRQLSVEDLNGSGCGNANSLLNSISSNCGNNSILHDQLGQMKSETEDSL